MIKVFNTKLITVVCLIVLVVLAGIYIAGGQMLPASIKSSFQNKNCQQGLTVSKFYLSAYPAFLADQNISDLSKECAMYAAATEVEQKKNWQAAFNAYKTYKQTYPAGMFAAEANEHSALILTTWAKEQLAAKQYTEAIENIDLVLNHFATTSVAANASQLIPDIYITWAKDQCEASNFTEAQTTLKALNTWAQDANKSEYIKLAQNELAQMYMTWGLSLQSAQQFEDAKIKFDLAASTSPESSAKAKNAIVSLYIGWGNALIAKNDVPGAIEHYQTAISLADEKEKPAIRDQIATAHLKSADLLSNKEDFLGALKEVEQAKEFAASDNAKKDIQTAHTAIYQAFSKSTGKQAQQAMADVIEKTCTHKETETSIFGTNKNNIRAALYVHYQTVDKGILTEKIRANTPESLHYVACATEKTEKVTLSNSRPLFNRDPEYGAYSAEELARHTHYTVERVTLFWNIEIYELKTGKLITTKLFAGSSPPSWRDAWIFMNNNLDAFGSLSGNPPAPEEISAWLEQYLK